MKTSVIPGPCDPRQRLDPYRLLAVLHLHCLLFRRTVLPDGFLISEELRAVGFASPHRSFPELFRRGYLALALRDTAGGSLWSLRPQLREAIERGTYEPFEGHNELYVDDSAARFLHEIDDAAARSEPLVWNAARLGTSLRALLAREAQEPPYGIDPVFAAKAFRWVDSRAERNGTATPLHTRSLWYSLAAKTSNALLGNKVRLWIDAAYARNLARAIGAGWSTSRSEIRSRERVDPFDAKAAPNGSDLEVLRGRSLAVVHPHFLAHLQPDEIAEIRETREFEDLQDALEAEQTDAYAHRVAELLRRLAHEAPRFFKPHRSRMELWSTAESARLRVVDGECVVAVHVDRNAPMAFASIPSAAVGGGLELFSFAMSKLASRPPDAAPAPGQVVEEVIAMKTADLCFDL
ncbi:MAG TPA: hypothetical protein VKE69_14545 [Planctomycetota bacterium]|nr:hypothetical protein [Planctomycetota bacterium]